MVPVVGKTGDGVNSQAPEGATSSQRTERNSDVATTVAKALLCAVDSHAPQALPGAFAGRYYASMIYLKCILAGLCFLVGAAILLLLGAIVFITIFVVRGKGTTIGFDPVSFARSFPVVWILAALIFVLGFVWEYRRVASR